jgi:hypothetical protein
LINKSFDTNLIFYFGALLIKTIKKLDIYLMQKRLVNSFLPLLIRREEATEV